MADTTEFIRDLVILLLRLGAIGALAVVVAYCAVRAGSLAYFRTKLEHFRTTMRELNKRR